MGDLVRDLSDLAPLTRRTVLRVFAVAAVGLLAGCRSSKRPAAAPAPGTSPASLAQTPSPTPTVTAQPTLSPDELLARRVAIAETELVAAYDAAALQHPELASLLAPFRADHAAHADALVPGAASPPPPSSKLPPSTLPSAPSSSSASPSGASPSGAPSSSAPPPNPVLIQLAGAERSAAAARIDDLATTTGTLASLLASIGGCEAAHAALLATVRSAP